METHNGNQFGNNFYFNSISEQLSKVFGGGLTPSSERLNPGLVDRVIQGSGTTTVTTLQIANTSTKKRVKITFSGTWSIGDTIVQTLTSSLNPSDTITHTVVLTENKTDAGMTHLFPAGPWYNTYHLSLIHI